MTVFAHSIIVICFKFLFVERLGPTAALVFRHIVNACNPQIQQFFTKSLHEKISVNFSDINSEFDLEIKAND